MNAQPAQMVPVSGRTEGRDTEEGGFRQPVAGGGVSWRMAFVSCTTWPSGGANAVDAPMHGDEALKLQDL